MNELIGVSSRKTAAHCPQKKAVTRNVPLPLPWAPPSTEETRMKRFPREPIGQRSG